MSYRPYPWHTDVIVDVNFHFRVWISINTNSQYVHHEYLTFLINFAISISRHISYFYHIFHIFRTMMILPSFHIFHIFRNMMILPSFHIFHIFSEYDDIAKFLDAGHHPDELRVQPAGKCTSINESLFYQRVFVACALSIYKSRTL